VEAPVVPWNKINNIMLVLVVLLEAGTLITGWALSSQLD
jgi:hypothetical protein